MKIHHLRQEQVLPLPADEAWEFFSRPSNLEKITPPDLGFENVYQSHETLTEGMLIVHRIRLAPLLRLNWVSEIRYIDPGRSFVDEQRSGPYAFWQHRHQFEQDGTSTRMIDEVHYALPFHPFSAPAHGLMVKSQLMRIFRFRRESIEAYFKSD